MLTSVHYHSVFKESILTEISTFDSTVFKGDTQVVTCFS